MPLQWLWKSSEIMDWQDATCGDDVRHHDGLLEGLWRPGEVPVQPLAEHRSILGDERLQARMARRIQLKLNKCLDEQRAAPEFLLSLVGNYDPQVWKSRES